MFLRLTPLIARCASVVVVRLHLRVVLLDVLFALMKRAEVGVPELLTVPTTERVELAGARGLAPEERSSLERAFRMRGLLVATLKYALSKLNVKAVMEEMVRVKRGERVEHCHNR